MKKNIVLLAGDGIGPDVTRAATTVLRETAQEFNHQFEFAEFPIGGAAIDVAGASLPNATLDACRKADAVLLGAVGGQATRNGLARTSPRIGPLRQRSPGEAPGATVRHFTA